MAVFDVVSFLRGQDGLNEYNMKRWPLLTVYSVVQPTFSWGHLSITEDAFRKILASLRIFTPFLQVVHTFGQKTNDKQRARDLVYDRLYPSATYGLFHTNHLWKAVKLT
jgi:hypothetical protein